MKSGWLVAFLLCLFLIGCGGTQEPVNKDKDMPVPPPKKEKEKDKEK